MSRCWTIPRFPDEDLRLAAPIAFRYRGWIEDEPTGEGLGATRPPGLRVSVVLEGAVVRPIQVRGSVVIGRADDADVHIAHGSVSRRHAILDVDSMTLIDLGSRNGSAVRGERIAANVLTEVRPTDTLHVGDIAIVLGPAGAVPTTGAPVQDIPLELRLVEEAARSTRTNEPFVHARIHVAPTDADAARELLVDALRTSDVLAEDGPGQFQILLPSVPADRGRPVVERLVTSLAASGISTRTGVAAFPVDGVTGAQLSARARELVATTASDRTAMDEVRHMLASVATGDLTVLIAGETGAGKELFAEMLHRSSRRARGPFVRLNCAAIPEPLLESELFGHARGAFTGADVARVGLVEAAAGGTLLLDEIGEMSMRLQASLLRVLEERVVRRVGETDTRPVDVRIVCATNRPLLEEADAGRFRRDLYYRISGITLTVPALRERPGEIESIARAFAAVATARTRRTAPVFADDAIDALRTYAWPGNIRELRNVIERAVLLSANGPVRASELGLVAPARTAPPTLSSAVAELERTRILEAMEKYGGNQTRVARALGLSRTTLIARLDAYALRRPRKI